MAIRSIHNARLMIAIMFAAAVLTAGCGEYEPSPAPRPPQSSSSAPPQSSAAAPTTSPAAGANQPASPIAPTADAKDSLDPGRKSLQGTWVVVSGEADGKPIPANVIERMRFTFKGDKLLIAGNSADGREVECAYEVDPKQTPKHFSYTKPTDSAPNQGIYELNGDKLKFCVRIGGGQRPTEFTTSGGPGLRLFQLQRQKP